MRRLLPALVAAGWLTACGYIGGPQPPLANIPSDIADLSANQRGARILVEFAVPQLTTERLPIKPPIELDLRIGIAPDPFKLDEWASRATAVREVSISKGTARCQIPATPWSGKRTAIAVRAIGSNGKESHWSKPVILPVVPPPDQPAGLVAEATAQGVRLTWTARGGEFQILRRVGSDEFTSVAAVREHTWVDTGVAYGASYAYQVQTVVDAGEGRKATSDLSAEVRIVPEDTFPPAAPAGLRAAAAPGSIELSWDRNTESDLAGYRVYRAAGSAAFEKIAEVGEIPAWSDHTAEPGKSYRYTITAFDKTGNESSRSQPAEAAIQP